MRKVLRNALRSAVRNGPNVVKVVVPGRNRSSRPSSLVSEQTQTLPSGAATTPGPLALNQIPTGTCLCNWTARGVLCCGVKDGTDAWGSTVTGFKPYSPNHGHVGHRILEGARKKATWIRVFNRYAGKINVFLVFSVGPSVPYFNLPGWPGRPDRPAGGTASSPGRGTCSPGRRPPT